MTSPQTATASPSESSPQLSAPRVALLSGASRGVGRAIATELAQRGMAVVLLHSPHGAADAAATVSHLRTLGVDAAAFPADVSNEDEVGSAFDAALTQFGRVDVVVNGAGHVPLAPLIDLDLAQLDDLHRTLVRGVFVMCQRAARVLPLGGTIVNLSSSLVGLDRPGTAGYVAGKAAVEGVTGILARELDVRGISVNTVSVDHTDDATPGSTAGVASLVGYLTSADGHWMSGHVLPGTAGPTPSDLYPRGT